MKIKKGNYRTVVLIGPVAIKFIRLDLFLALLKRFFEFDNDHYWRRIVNQKNFSRLYWIRGIVSNITEYFTYLLLKNQNIKFLAPTYFSCGIFSIQKRIEGENMDCELVVKIIINSIPESEKGLWTFIEPHTLWDNDGWYLCGNQYILTDYGDLFGVGMPFSQALHKHQRYLKKCLTIEPS